MLEKGSHKNNGFPDRQVYHLVIKMTMPDRDSGCEHGAGAEEDRVSEELDPDD